MTFTPGKTRISYGGAMIGLEEVKAIFDVIFSQGGSRWTVGEESKLLEKELAKVAGVKRAVLTNSGSSALLVAMTALHLPKGSKVIVPACTFPTAFNAIIQNGLMPVVVDVELTSLNIDFVEVKKALLKYPDIKAVIAVDIAGNPVDLIGLRRIVGDRIIILDDCDGFGTKLADRMIEQYADISCVSFHAAHIVTMGEGGAVLTNNEQWADSAAKIREWGRESGSDKGYNYEGLPADYPERYTYTEIGYNIKPLELQCAMGRVQLRKLQSFVDARFQNYWYMNGQFAKMSDKITVVGCAIDATPCWFSFPFLVKGDRRRALRLFEENNIEARTIFSGNILRHPAYDGVEFIQIGSLKNSDYILEHGMFLSCHPSLTQEMISYIGQVATHL